MSLDTFIKKITSQRLRNALRPEVQYAQRSYQKARQLLGATGRLPDFLILGAQKAGTTSLYDSIMKHPQTSAARTKEIAYFDRHYEWGTDWYKSNFPIGDRITGEATPDYLFSDLARQRIAETLPQHTKFIVVLRNPVDRAISHYFHEKRLGYETLDILEAMELEQERLSEIPNKLVGRKYENRTVSHSYSYMARGDYVSQLSKYFKLFPRANFYIETSDRFFRSPGEVTNEVFEFLKLPAIELPDAKPKNVGVYSGKVEPKIYEMLSLHFHDKNRELETLLEKKLPW